jgi:hypothetical protein
MIPFDSRKFFSYALIIFILLVTAGSNWLTMSKGFLIGGWVLFTGVYFYFENYIKPKFFVLLGIFVVVSGLYFLLNNAYNGVTYSGFLLNICLAYYCRDFIKDNFYTYFTHIIYVSACISLVLYPLQLLNFDLMYNLNNLMGLSEAGDYGKSNSFIFTMVPIHVIRNCGFAWEPGGFATILTMTFFINLFNIGEPLTSKRNIVFFIAIATTQSTMGLLSMLIPLSLILKDFIMKSRTTQQLSVVIIPMVLIAFGTLFTEVDFLYDKIEKEITGLDIEMEEVERARIENNTIAVSRSMSVILDMQTIKKYPLFGLGVDFRTTGFSKMSVDENLQTACGTTVLLMRFGFIGFFLYNFLLFRFADFESNLYKGAWVLLINYALFTQEVSATPYFHLFVF